jgi:hypothetical protein
MDEAKNAFERAVAEMCEEISRPELSPQGRVTAIARAALSNVHPDNFNRASVMVAEFRRDAIQMLKELDYAALKTRADQFHRLMRSSGLQNPAPAPDPMIAVRVAAARMGWTPFEITAIEGHVRRGHKIGRITWKDAEIGESLMTREALREELKPAFAKTAPTWNEAAWRGQFPDIREVRIRADGQAEFVR